MNEPHHIFYQKHKDNYNFKNYVMIFISDNIAQLKQLQKFSHINLGSSDVASQIAYAMVLTPDQIKNFNQNAFISSKNNETIIKNQLCVNTEAIKNIYNYGDKSPETFLMEYTYGTDANIRKGTMSFTTCHTVDPTINLGCNYNISLATQFYGVSNLFLGRLVLFNTLCNLNVKRFSLCSDSDRFILEKIYTRTILGDDYQLDDNGSSNIKFTTRDWFKGCNDCLPQKVIYFYLDLYNETRYQSIVNKHTNDSQGMSFFDYYGTQNDPNYPALDGIIIPDQPTNQDPLYGFPIRGVELRIFNAHRYVRVEGVYYNGTIYKTLLSWDKQIRPALEIYIELADKIFKDFEDVTNKMWSYNLVTQKSASAAAFVTENYEKLLKTFFPKEVTSDDFAKQCNTLKSYCETIRSTQQIPWRNDVQQHGGKNLNNYYYKYNKYKQKYFMLRKKDNFRKIEY